MMEADFRPARTEAELAAVVGRSAVVPVIRESDPGRAAEIAGWCIDAGLEAIELTATIPEWERVLADVGAGAGPALVGLGTVRAASTAERALAAGAAFLVTPHPSPDVRAVAADAGAALIEGGFTPAEVLAAADRGIAKLFPAAALGPSYLRSLLALESAARIVPTGGIGLGDAEDWLGAGALAVGIGGGLEPSAATRDRLAELRAAAAGGERGPR